MRMESGILRSLIGQPHHWWETLDYDCGLKVHQNPRYIDSMGEKSAVVSGEIDSERPLKKGDCVRIVTAKPASVAPQTFDRYLLDVAA